MISAQHKTGRERFLCQGKELPFDVLSFWQWSSSNLLGNALRGILAEYIVAKAIGATNQVREEWDAYDLLSPSGKKIEVKSAAYLQSWEQSQLSRIQFSIRPTRVWLCINDNGTDARGELMRQADVYVFCVLAHQDRETVNPLNLDQLQFYVLESAVLDERLGKQKTLSLSGLNNLQPKNCNFSGLSNVV